MRPPIQFNTAPRAVRSLPSRPSRRLDKGLDVGQKNHRENAISGGYVASFTVYRYGTRVPDLHPLTGVNRLRLLLVVGSPCNSRNHSTPSQGPGSHQVTDSLCLRLSAYSFRSSSLCYSIWPEEYHDSYPLSIRQPRVLKKSLRRREREAGEEEQAVAPGWDPSAGATNWLKDWPVALVSRNQRGLPAAESMTPIRCQRPKTAWQKERSRPWCSMAPPGRQIQPPICGS